MLYNEFVEVYESLASTSGKIEKAEILSKFLLKLEKHGKPEWIYILRGRAVPDYDVRELGISRQLAIKAIARGMGISESEIVRKFNKVGDLGEIADEFDFKRKQQSLFSSKLQTEKVFSNLHKLMELTGKGSVDKKMVLIAELFGNANGKEAKYIVRTLLSDLRIGVAEGVLKDGITLAFFEKDEEAKQLVEDAFDFSGDFASVFKAAVKGKKALESIEIEPGKPIYVMLAVKAEDMEDAFRICGKPAAIEHKYDGFRMVISKSKGEFRLFTRRMEEFTKQFPDVIEAAKKYVRADSFIIDTEVVGYDPKTGKSKPFQAMSQRIKRKYDIDKLIKELPVEINAFDVLYLNGKSVMKKPFVERRKLLKEIIMERDKKIRLAVQLVTDDLKKAEEFYKNALKIGEEGIIMKNLNAPYKQERKVGYIIKLKPEMKDLDLVIVGAEYGSGKRAGWLTSYYVACFDKDNEDYLEVGKVSSGLKEKESEVDGNITYEEMSKLLKPLIKEGKGTYVKIKPEVVVSVLYQEIQKSPAYNSGYALRFPRITAYRPDRTKKEITTLKEIKEAMIRKYK